MARLRHRREIDGSGSRKVGNLKIEKTADGRRRVTARRGADDERSLWDIFKKAIAYARRAHGRSEYTEAAEALHTTAFKVATADFLHPPEIRAIDLDGYHGCPGDVIRVHAVDDQQVRHVGVLIMDEENHLVEMGLASPSAPVDWWEYSALRQAPGHHVRIIVDVSDLPGHAEEVRVDKELP